MPAAYRQLFRGRRALLNSHSGYDAGALVMAMALAKAFRALRVTSSISRLVIDLNRSIGHPQLFSAATRGVPASVRNEIVAHYYRPYRAQAEQFVKQAACRGQRIIHISSHSFTPVLNGKVRNADVGLLYHPGRLGEVSLCARWRAALAACAPQLRVRRNYPYAGKGDGLTSHLRQRFSADAYVGIELEVNQSIVLDAGPPWTALRRLVVESLHMATGDF